MTAAGRKRRRAGKQAGGDCCGMWILGSRADMDSGRASNVIERDPRWPRVLRNRCTLLLATRDRELGSCCAGGGIHLTVPWFTASPCVTCLSPVTAPKTPLPKGEGRGPDGQEAGVARWALGYRQPLSEGRGRGSFCSAQGCAAPEQIEGGAHGHWHLTLGLSSKADRGSASESASERWKGERGRDARRARRDERGGKSAMTSMTCRLGRSPRTSASVPATKYNTIQYTTPHTRTRTHYAVIITAARRPPFL
ncbi:hypothetical protein K504DRAFT_447809 [Pleomassaria siparia CBS 279.74]|uniref:Uncharacterized protein n=1 Tax=Pleomassaria siparia CBS 279.74 TaxID=1314801 RepID=A0A6G1K2V6_9PLEO|nr:hypothetical protein K504DRAFT_447809 [Pleomassaria siparia CBS 279.74]